MSVLYIVQESGYKNFCMIPIWASKHKYDLGPKMWKFRSSRCKETRGRRKRRRRRKKR